MARPRYTASRPCRLPSASKQPLHQSPRQQACTADPVHELLARRLAGEVDADALKQDELELVLQVNGKLRGKLVVAATADRAAIEEAAKASAEVAKHSNGASVKKVVIVPGRLVNVVV